MTSQYLFPQMSKTTWPPLRMLALGKSLWMSDVVGQSAASASWYHARNCCSASACSLQNTDRVLWAITLTSAETYLVPILGTTHALAPSRSERVTKDPSGPGRAVSIEIANEEVPRVAQRY